MYEHVIAIPDVESLIAELEIVLSGSLLLIEYDGKLIPLAHIGICRVKEAEDGSFTPTDDTHYGYAVVFTAD